MLIKLRKAQNTAEYAIVLGLIVGAVIAMQVYVKRGLQGRIHQFATSSPYATEFEGAGLNITKQYEPYYLDSGFNVTRSSSGYGEVTSGAGFFRNTTDEVKRTEGSQQYLYGGGSGGDILPEP